ncbi:hypothetical protein [Neolewinella persica]|uniref:hypothetical protein n=1 Tax=Neolewinella persica TaxID=70998 RepID=UPI00036D17ED|nr:hypothetical protein [Neolewinella persica]
MAAEISILGRVISLLSSQPTDEAIIALKATEAEEERVDYLANLKNEGAIIKEEKEELYNALLAEYVIGIAKSNAFARMNSTVN